MTRLALACLLAAAAFSAAAAEPVAVSVVETDARGTKVEAAVITPDLAKTRVVADTGCVRSSGSRVRRPVDANGCNGLPGSSITRARLDQTGAATTAEALKRADPRL